MEWDWMTFAQGTDPSPLRDKMREWERDEAAKMEQERSDWGPSQGWGCSEMRNAQDGFDRYQPEEGVQEVEPWDVEQDYLGRRRRMRRERSYGSSHVDLGGGDAKHSDQRLERSVQLKCENLSGPSHVDDGSVDARRLNQWVPVNLIDGEVTQDRT
jgi:hypothetical protein